LMCGIAFAGHLVGIGHFTKKSDPILLTILQMFFTAAFSWIGTIFFGGELGAMNISGELITSMLYLGVLSSATGFLLQTVSQRYVAPSAAALLISTESIFGVIFSSLFLGEVMTRRMIVGCIILMIAITIAETKLDLSTLLKRIKKGNT